MPEQFPRIGLKPDSLDRNPAIRLFGRRIFVDQTVPELLLEFLLVASSVKRIGVDKAPFSTIFPQINLLHSWPTGCGLEYSSKARLNLKLIAFLGVSKIDTRHESHRQHYRSLIRELHSPDKMNPGFLDKNEVLKTIENLFLGFQSVCGQRTWCSASFMPISRELIADESIWKETAARANCVNNWDDALRYFSHTQQLFLARSGALLYLQVCNALSQKSDEVQSWADFAGLSLAHKESSPSELHAALEHAINAALNACPETVGRIAEFIDTGIDSETARHSDFRADSNEPRYASCGWCPEESWHEGLLFAIELLRICEAVIDPIERMEMLEIACAMQVLRSLCAQSARYSLKAAERTGGIGPLGYIWAISDPAGDQTVIKQISRRNVNAVQRLIHDALRHPDILAGFGRINDSELEKIYKEADGRYGHKLFLTVAKRIGLIVPKRGAGARFIFNDRLLRFLVLSVLRPGVRVTYETFKKLLLAHYGIAVDDAGLASSCEWSGTSRLTTLGGGTDEWLIEMLDAAGVLIRLSDSCSLVQNPFDDKETPE